MAEGRSLGGQVFEKIRSNIVEGIYKNGEVLREVSLGEELGVSRTPVREALHQLELEGLVEIVPNKGARVRGISQKDIQDIYHMRSYLEGMAARWAAKNISKEDLEELEEVIYLAKFQLKKAGRSSHVVELDGKFHEILYRATGSRMMEHILKDFCKYVQMARSFSLSGNERAQKSVEEHEAIFEAIKNKDGDLAEKLANEHILHVMENLSLNE